MPATPLPPAPRRRAHGFTLVEVMVALTIMSLIMVALYTTLNTGLRTRDQLETQAQVARLGPQILDLIENDLRRAWVLNIDGDTVFKGETRTINGEPADSLSLLTTVDSTVTRRVDDREVSADVCETGYRLRANPRLPDVMELWRRQSFHVDDKPLEDGVYELLHDRIVGFQLRYLETVDKTVEKLTTWDASERHRLPALVEIELRLEAVPRTIEDFGKPDHGSRTLTYHRVVALGKNSELAMRIHPLPPVFTGADADGAGGGDPNYDTDGDGIPDYQDDDIDGDTVLNKDDDDIDGDDVPNGEDQSPNGGGPPGGQSNGGGGGGGNHSGDGDDEDDIFGGGGSGGGGSGSGSGGSGGSAGDDFSDALEDLLSGSGG